MKSKKIIYILCYVAMSVLFLNFMACKKNESLEGISDTKGLQGEENITLKEELISYSGIKDEINSIEVSGNEVPVIVTKENIKEGWKCNGYQWVTGEWSKIELPWSEAMQKQRFDDYIPSIPKKEQDGNYYFLDVKVDKTKIEPNGEPKVIFSLYRMENDKKFEKLKTKNEMFIRGKSESRESIVNYSILDNNTILIFYDVGKIICYDLTNFKKINEIDGISLRYGNLCGNNFYSMSETMDKIQVTDVNDGEMIEEIDFKIKDKERMVRFCLDEEDNLYIATREGIYCKYSDSEVVECLISSDECTIYTLKDKENISIRGISKKDDSIYVSYRTLDDEAGDKIYEYKIIR